MKVLYESEIYPMDRLIVWSIKSFWQRPAISILRQNEEALSLLLFQPIWHFADQRMLLHSCVSALVKRKIVAKRSVTNGGMYGARLCSSMCLCIWVHTYGSVDVRVLGCIRTLEAAGARTWLITCVLCWKSFKLKQNGLQNIWPHQTCSVQCEVDEMWQSFLFWHLCSTMSVRSDAIIVSGQTWDDPL